MLESVFGFPKFQADIIKRSNDGFRVRYLRHRAMIRGVPRLVTVLVTFLAGIRARKPIAVYFNGAIFRLSRIEYRNRVFVILLV